MNSQKHQSAKEEKDTPETVIFQCNCDEIKDIKVVYDGGFGEKFTVEFCNACYTSDNKKFVLSLETLDASLEAESESCR